MSTTEAGRLAAFGKPDSISLPGVSLQVVIEAARRLDELSCARIVGNIAELVHAAQKGGQPLGTLTPAAILVLPDGGVKLATGAALPSYTAPEKLRGGAGDRRSDVFALGVVLWEALAHERLFGGANDDAIKQAVLAQAFRPPSELNANVPAELDAICKKALARDPSDRYQSARVMAAELDAVLDDAGYPESNEAIAKYVARSVATAPAAPVLPVPSVVPAPSVLPVLHPPSKTVPLPSVVPSSAAVPSVFASRPPAQTAILGSSNPPAEPMPPPSIIEPPLKPVARAEAAPAKSARTEILGSIAGAPQGEKPSLAVTAFLGSNASTVPAPAVPTTPSPALHGVPAAPVAPSPTTPASAAPPAAPALSPSMVPAAPAAPAIAPPVLPPAYAAPVPFVPTASVAPDFGPPAMPAPITAPGHAPPVRTSPATPAPPVRTSPPTPAPPIRTSPPTPAPTQAAAPDPRHPLPAPFKPVVHPQPPNKTSIANAETITTPQLPPHLDVPPAAPQLGMPPGMTVPPVSPGAPLQSSDQEFQAFGEDEHHSDPAEVIALHHAEKAKTGSRDVLAGWGWSTGSVQAIDDEDVHALHDTVRAGRKRLLLAIGGALGVVLIVAVVAFAFSGSQKPSNQDERASAAKSAAAVPSSPATTPEPGVAPPPAPSNPAPAPPGPEPAAPPAPEPAKVEPPTAEPPAAEPSAAEPPKAAVVEPAKPEPSNVEPPRAEPPKPEPPKVAAAIKAPEPPKAEPPKAEPPKKLEAKKPPEPKKSPDKALKRPPPADKLAKATAKAPPANKAQPVDPYAAPADKPKADPAAAYKTGLQQYARGDTSGALATLRTSLSSNPSFAPTWRGLGLVYEKLGNKGQARSAFKRYLQLAPDAGDADQIRERLEHLGS